MSWYMYVTLLYILLFIKDCAAADVTFIVDSSGSVVKDSVRGIDNWIDILQFLVNIVDSVNIATNAINVAVINFSRYD